MRTNLTIGALAAVLLALVMILVPVQAQTPVRPGAVCTAGQYIYYDTTAAQWKCSTDTLLTSFSGVTATAAEVNTLAGVTAGTATASKALVVNASRRLDYLDLTSLAIGATAVTATAAELNYLHAKNPLVGVGASYKIARGVTSTASAADTVASGLATVVAVICTLQDDAALDPGLTTCSVGDQVSAPVAGSFYLKTWKFTSSSNPTPLAATTFTKKVNWIAIGT